MGIPASGQISTRRRCGRLDRNPPRGKPPPLGSTSPTQKEFDRFRVLFERRFPATPKDTSSRGFMTGLEEFKQEPEETIKTYREREVDMRAQVDV